MESIFSNGFDCDKLFVSKFDEETSADMILYAYVESQTAQKLFDYFYGYRFNTTQDYINRNPLQVPIKLYESPEIAKIFAAESNSQLVAFSICIGNCKIYDEFDLYMQFNIRKSKINKEEYKSKLLLWREKQKYNNYEYIVYTIRDKRLISEIQLRDSK